MWQLMVASEDTWIVIMDNLSEKECKVYLENYTLAFGGDKFKCQKL